MLRYYIIYKPYHVLSQFSSIDPASAGDEKKKTLKDLFTVPEDVYPLGRLDYDSEGLLILTNDRKLNHLLLNPDFAHEREYWVQVDGIPGKMALEELASGVEITVDGIKYRSKKSVVEVFPEQPDVPARNPPIRIRKNVPVTWIKIVLTEGKNRQVRKMTAKVGHPTLRLIRYRIGNVNLNGLQPGKIKELKAIEVQQLLFNK